ncbi:MAG TPA: AzlC family ABC transporter permease [Thermoflexales bacterium]|nr:AzlC family ABC transporter permease [Thermoflexales bacterium]HQW35588.1 AzlC family ABC transporter permease [Thermoflexales bacterium]HQZ22651.1 AzlC family ABC transporter permease [Thermoflexales bacterium]HQZ99843.1 AzlC family ABC transporter permease [Thermoflexales bacterium]
MEIEKNVATPQAQFKLGMKALLPSLAAVAPFGIIGGAITALALKNVLGAAIMSVAVFAGRSQLIGLQLDKDGSPLFVVFAACLIVNLRNLLYGATVAPHFKHLSWKWKFLLAFLLSDQNFAISIPHLIKESRTASAPYRHYFFLGGGLVVWLTWSVTAVLGAALASQVPSNIGLDFVPHLAFIAILVPAIKDFPALAAALVAGVASVALAGLPWSAGLFVGGVSGIIAGMVMESRRAKTIVIEEVS